MTRTPPFLSWSIDQECSLREPLASGPATPQQVERQLRALSVYALCVREGRRHGDLCFERFAEQLEDDSDAWAFRADEVLAAYGGRALISRLCTRCPANAGRLAAAVPDEVSGGDGTDDDASAGAGEPAGPWAGCYGWLTVSSGHMGLGAQQSLGGPLAAAPNLPAVALTRYLPALELLDDWLAESAEVVKLVADCLLPTRPRWYGLWAEGQPDRRQRLALLAVLDCWSSRDGQVATTLEPLRQAVRYSLQSGQPLRIQWVPGGHLDGKYWHLPPHCGRCAAELPDAGRRCPACGGNSPQAARRRLAMGRRPFWPLSRLVGAVAAREAIHQYRLARSGAPSAPGRAESPRSLHPQPETGHRND